MSDLKKLPAWLTVTPESAAITLSRPSEINGVNVDRLTLRSPTVREVRAANATSGGDDELREMHLFASLFRSRYQGSGGAQADGLPTAAGRLFSPGARRRDLALSYRKRSRNVWL